ncbi:MAG: NAD(P)/FAD-dependent oxidoreductase, partial [Gammaproteobacteria bacterium]|nr:NAD(P)/FAD-dependent oxidoreductase [Gammaproteobacteria bacterium]
MQSVLKEKPAGVNQSMQTDPVVIVGSGPVGVQSLKELYRLSPQQAIVIYGDEAYVPYNRVRLSGLLSGQFSLSDIETDLSCTSEPHIIQRQHTRVIQIHTDKHSVIDDQGVEQPYSSLILATGSRPHVPNIQNIHLPGVFRFRDMADVQALMARQARSRNIVILGGGLLGLEAAHAMQRHNSNVIVIDHMDRLMPQQLDEDGAELLREHILRLGIQVVLSDRVAEIIGEEKIQAVRLQSGRVIECDTMILSAGIRSNIELARDAGVVVGQGIKVDNTM